MLPPSIADPRLPMPAPKYRHSMWLLALFSLEVLASQPRRKFPPAVTPPATAQSVALQLLEGGGPGLCYCEISQVHAAPLRHVVFGGSRIVRIDPSTGAALSATAPRLENGKSAPLDPQTGRHPQKVIDLHRGSTRGLALKVVDWFKGQPIDGHFYGISHYPSCAAEWTPQAGQRRLFLIAADGGIRPVSGCEGLDPANGIDETAVLAQLRALQAELPRESLRTDNDLNRLPVDPAAP